MLPARSGRHIPHLHDYRSCSDDRHSGGSDDGSHASKRSFTRCGAAVPCDRPHCIPYRRRPVRNPGDPAVSDAALRRDAWSDGLCGQCQHDRHGSRRTGGRILQSAYRPQEGDSSKPPSARDPDKSACGRAKPHCLHHSSHHAGLQPLRSHLPIWASGAARWMPAAPSPPILPGTSQAI